MKFRSSLWMAAMTIMALTLCIGCSDDDDPVTPPVAHDASATIGATGGEIMIANEIQLEIPPNALTADADFTIDDATAEHPATISERTAISPVYAMGPDGTTFENLVDLTIYYDPAELDGDDESGLVIYTDAGAGWLPLTTTLNAMDNFGSAEIEHLSYFCITAPIPPVHDAEATLGVAGGSIGLLNEIGLDIDENALTADAYFTIDELETGYATIPADRLLVSPVWEIGQDGTTFLSPANLVINYDSSLLTTQSETDLAIYTDEGEGWVPVTTSIDAEPAHSRRS